MSVHEVTREREWLRCNDPALMLRWLMGWRKAAENPTPATEGCPKYAVSDRKLRLIACGLCRHVWAHLPDHRTRRLLGVAEDRSEGGSRAISALVHIEAMSPDTLAEAAARLPRDFRCRQAVYWCHSSDFVSAPEQVLGLLSPEVSQRLACQVIRDVVGAPFRPPEICPECPPGDKEQCPRWQAIRTADIVSLAQAAYDERTEGDHLCPDRLAILADALEEAGCPEQSILDHLREECASGEGGIDYHVRGCWALDLILGKS